LLTNSLKHKSNITNIIETSLISCDVRNEEEKKRDGKGLDNSLLELETGGNWVGLKKEEEEEVLVVEVVLVLVLVVLVQNCELVKAQLQILRM